MQHLAEALYQVAQIRQAEQVAINQLHIPGLQLMRDAGAAVFRHIASRWPTVRQLAIFCGAGNNAGDGYVVARLALLADYQVQVYALADVAALKGDALTSCLEFINAGGSITEFSGDYEPVGTEIIVDALLGTGLNRSVSKQYESAIDVINMSACPVVAVDIPSGLHADSGAIMGAAVVADMTISFIGLKTGLFTGQAADCCGEILLESLNLPEAVFSGETPVAQLLVKSPLPPRPRAAHKGNFGHVLLVGGNHGYSGAIRLAAEAALRSGAGLVSVASRAAHAGYLNIGRPELMCHGVESVDQLSGLLNKAGVVVIGPGLGQDAWAEMLLAEVLAADKPCVLDADGLNLLAGLGGKMAHWILTPHPGEAARLLACNTADIAGNRYAAVNRLQARYGGVCILKGAGSLIADGQSIYVGSTGNPGMATAGMGDVLSGILGGLLAQGLSLGDAARLGVYVHGEAADRVAARQGERGMLAGDLFAELLRCLN